MGEVLKITGKAVERREEEIGTFCRVGGIAVASRAQCRPTVQTAVWTGLEQCLCRGSVRRQRSRSLVTYTVAGRGQEVAPDAAAEGGYG